MSDGADPTFWQWAADAALAAMTAVGGFLFKSYVDRVKALEEAHRNLATTDYIDGRIDEMTEERRWMHEQNTERFEAITKRLDRVLER